jgi:hypothetical protein
LALLQIIMKEFGDDRRFRLLDPNSGGIARTVRVDPIPVRRSRPRQEDAGLIFHETPPAHSFGDERALIFGDRSSDLKKELVVRILTHRTIQKGHLASLFLQFLDQERLVDLLPGEPVGGGEPDGADFPQRRPVAQSIQAGSVQRRAAVAVITEDIPFRQFLAFGLEVSAKPI